MRQGTLQVTVDSRERNLELLEALRSFEDVEIGFALLRNGDYLWSGGLLFERKTLSDLLSSLRNCRLLRQAYRLHHFAKRPVLILEGTLFDLIPQIPAVGRVDDDFNRLAPPERWSRRLPQLRRVAIQGALIHVAVGLGIPILRSTSPSESAWLMRCALGQTHPGRKPRARIRAPHWPRTTSLERTQLRLLQQLPGVGPDRAQSLLTHFGSPSRVLNATIRELERAPGIGKTIAQKIRAVASKALVDLSNPA